MILQKKIGEKSDSIFEILEDFFFADFAENWLSCSSQKINVRNFRVLVKQLFYGNEIQFFRKKFTGDF